MVNWSVPGGDVVVACSVMVWLEPSGSVRPNAIVSPEFGLEPRLTEIDGGEPMTVAPVKVEFTPASLKPNGEPSELSVTLGACRRSLRRPRLPVPSSACRRSEMTCVKSRLSAVAVEDVAGAGDRRLIQRAAREHVIVADLGIEQRKNLIEIACGRLLGRRLPVVVERKRSSAD